MKHYETYKLPRLYVEANLASGAEIPFTPEQAHYFKTVMRRQDGDAVRLFNGRNGEWLCTLERLGKRDGFAVADEQIHEQPAQSRSVHLFFAPIKKSQLDWLVEKAVELGATDLHPVITQNTEVRDVNADRVNQQIIEAAEQCERLDRPTLHDTIKLPDVPKHVDAGTIFLAALERGDTKPISSVVQNDSSIAVLIGPEGGFTADETAWIQKQDGWVCVSLGPRILRAETAVCAALSAIMMKP